MSQLVTVYICCIQDDVFVFAKEYFSPFNPTPLKGKPIIIVGPSGVGKNTLVKAVLKKYDGVFERKISHSSRPKKGIEKTGNYYLISRDEFQQVSGEQLTFLS